MRRWLLLLRSKIDSTSNRVSLAAALFWLFYVVAEQPWNHDGWNAYHVPTWEKPVALFAKFGAHTAEALGFNPWDFGAIQFLSGLAALMLMVRLPFWVFPGRRKIRK